MALRASLDRTNRRTRRTCPALAGHSRRPSHCAAAMRTVRSSSRVTNHSARKANSLIMAGLAPTSFHKRWNEFAHRSSVELSVKIAHCDGRDHRLEREGTGARPFGACSPATATRRTGSPPRSSWSWARPNYCPALPANCVSEQKSHSAVVALAQIAVKGGPAYSERLADGGGGLSVGLHPACERGLVGVELGGATELLARLAGML